MNTLTVNLHLMMVSFYRPTRARNRILIEAGAFPSDQYAVASHAAFHGGDVVELKQKENPVERIERDGSSIALVILGNVNYLTGEAFDMRAIAQAAHDRGCVVGFNLAHGAGNLLLQLHDDDVDFAVWCSYKYLNAGPGAVAALYVNRRHHNRLPGLAGWWGHDKNTQFDMAHEFRPADNAGRWQISSNPQLSAAPLRASLAMFHEAGLDRLRAKSLRMTQYLMDCIDELPESHYGYGVGNPREPERRGGHIAVEHADADRICKALKRRGVIPDFRMPNVIRLAPIPLYNSFHECWRVVRNLKPIVDNKEFDEFSRGRDLIA